MSEPAFQQVVEKGREDVRQSNVIDNDEMQGRIESWQKQNGLLRPWLDYLKYLNILLWKTLLL